MSDHRADSDPGSSKARGSNYHQNCCSGLSFTFLHFMLCDSKIYCNPPFYGNDIYFWKDVALHSYTLRQMFKSKSYSHFKLKKPQPCSLSTLWHFKKNFFPSHPWDRSQYLSRIPIQGNSRIYTQPGISLFCWFTRTRCNKIQGALRTCLWAL